jgi:hypothetical protein
MSTQPPHRKLHLHALHKGKANPVRGRRGPQTRETSRFSHCLDSRLADGGEVASFSLRPVMLWPKKFPGTHFYKAESTPGL